MVPLKKVLQPRADRPPIQHPKATRRPPPGWVVQLQTYAVTNGQWAAMDGLVLADPGIIAAYTEPKSEFSLDSVLDHENTRAELRRYLARAQGVQQSIRAS